MSRADRQEFHLPIHHDGETAVSVLAHASGFSKQHIKRTMKDGAVWLTRGQHTQRLRRASKALKCGDELHLYYDESVLSAKVPAAQLIADEGEYSVWYKPCGMLSQGSKWGDHCTITRWAEQHLTPERTAFGVHRLDRATRGLIIIAHSKQAARLVSKAFYDRVVEKKYEAIIQGDHRQREQPDTICVPIDGRDACSHFRCLDYSPGEDCSLVDISIETGRKHQIRRHFESIGMPILGDRLYGHEVEHVDLQLLAYQLVFLCPITQQQQCYHVPEALRLSLVG